MSMFLRVIGGIVGFYFVTGALWSLFSFAFAGDAASGDIVSALFLQLLGSYMLLLAIKGSEEMATAVVGVFCGMALTVAGLYSVGSAMFEDGYNRVLTSADLLAFLFFGVVVLLGVYVFWASSATIRDVMARRRTMRFLERGENVAGLMLCDLCHGTGMRGKTITRKKCSKCKGQGYTAAPLPPVDTSEESLLEAGVDSHTRLQELKLLLVAGLVSEDEFDKKRNEILSDL